VSLSPNGLNYHLIFEDPTASDSGNYLCHASLSIAESITMNVLPSELSTC